MDKEAWKAFYSVLEESILVQDGDLGSYYSSQYYIIDVNSKERVYGPYRDLTYARKQARRKYRKLVRNMERAFMS